MSMVAAGQLFVLVERISQNDRYPVLSDPDFDTSLTTEVVATGCSARQGHPPDGKRYRNSIATIETEHRNQNLPLPGSRGPK